jgi:hypothetical protein
MKLEIFDGLFLNVQIKNSTELPAVGAELFHAGGRTEFTKLIAAVRNFCEFAYNHHVM